MNKEQIFSVWAPDVSLWSRWVKPVLFAHLDVGWSVVPLAPVTEDLSWVPSPAEKVALVVDLPGAEGVFAGLALAKLGYRPVPLYNAVPQPSGFLMPDLLDPLAHSGLAAVNVLPILCAISQGTHQLAAQKLPFDAPPAFLLDSNRVGDGLSVQPGEFDNRSISFTTDFPSANYFAANGIERVCLIQRDRLLPHQDLAHSLRRWQEAGFILERRRINFPEPRERFEVPRPTWYGAMFQRALAAVGFRRAWSGGFGGWMPAASAGG
jgi:hypothetical protein